MKELVCMKLRNLNLKLEVLWSQQPEAFKKRHGKIKCNFVMITLMSVETCTHREG